MITLQTVPQQHIVSDMQHMDKYFYIWPQITILSHQAFVFVFRAIATQCNALHKAAKVQLTDKTSALGHVTSQFILQRTVTLQ